MNFIAWVFLICSFIIVSFNYGCACQVAVTFVVLGSADTKGTTDAEKTAVYLRDQNATVKESIRVHILPKDLKDASVYNYIQIMERWHGIAFQDSCWVAFVESTSVINLHVLFKRLSEFDAQNELFLGRPLYDEETTIIHHFASVEHSRPFYYPDPRAGILLSFPLLKKLVMLYSSNQIARPEFLIDPPYELALMVNSAGHTLTASDAFCISPRPGCAFFYRPSADCPRKGSIERVHFAVKTCQKYHSSRLPVLRNTWLPDAPDFALYSDVTDADHGTLSLNIKNTESGHCAKTLGIISHASLKDIDWLVITDDDTLMSVSRLHGLLSCYNASESVAFGERYTYLGHKSQGYEYITGGGGMVFSMTLVKLLAAKCHCPAENSPDDMILGICLKNLGVPITNSRLFHQARPNDYSPLLLAGDEHISFHKFWNLDPEEAFLKWLVDPVSAGHHQEL